MKGLSALRKSPAWTLAAVVVSLFIVWHLRPAIFQSQVLPPDVRIVKVTNLNPQGPGSLLEAVQASGKRIIVFEVGGVIDLRDTNGVRPFLDLEMTQGNVVIAGETAPSPGITIIGAGLRIYTSNVIVRHLRIRPGQHANTRVNIGGALMVDSTNGQEVKNVLIQNNSLSWATDEIAEVYINDPYSPGLVKNIIFERNIISEGLMTRGAACTDASSCPASWVCNNGICNRGHAHGFLGGHGTQQITLVRNFFMSTTKRNPWLSYDGKMLFANNLIYNPNNQVMSLAAAGSVPAEFTGIGNVAIRGPSSNNALNARLMFVQSNVMPGTKVYLNDNLLEQRGGGHIGKDWAVSTDAAPGGSRVNNPLMSLPSGSPPILVSSQVEAAVFAEAGARRAEADPVDDRLRSEFEARNGQIPVDQNDVGGYPTRPSTTRPYNPCTLLPIPPGYIGNIQSDPSCGGGSSSSSARSSRVASSAPSSSAVSSSRASSSVPASSAASSTASNPSSVSSVSSSVPSSSTPSQISSSAPASSSAATSVASSVPSIASSVPSSSAVSSSMASSAAPAASSVPSVIASSSKPSSSSVSSGSSSNGAALRCGDGMRQPGEQCEDGNRESDDGCSRNCIIERFDPRTGTYLEGPGRCGDGMTNPAEQCDDANLRSGDGCSSRCRLEMGVPTSSPGDPPPPPRPAAPPPPPPPPQISMPLTCGDGIVNPGEQCDDFNAIPGDGCSAACRIEGPEGGGIITILPPSAPQPLCGNSRMDEGEECDNGSVCTGNPSIACRSDTECLRCMMVRGRARCGGSSLGPTCASDADCALSGFSCTYDIEVDFSCGDDCTRRAGAAPPRDGNAAWCGNGRVDEGEECDNGFVCDQNPGIFCETDYDCNRCFKIGKESRCGGVQSGEPCLADEECQEGSHRCLFNEDADRNCGPSCRKILRPEEFREIPVEQDVRQVMRYEAQKVIPVCGNRILEPGEICDDGNALAGDGCSVRCQPEKGAIERAVVDTLLTPLPMILHRQEFFFPSPSPALVPGTAPSPLPFWLSKAAPGPARPSAKSLPLPIPPALLPPESLPERVPSKLGGSVVETPPTLPSLNSSGPAALAVMISGAASGVAWIRRRQKKK